MSKRRSPSKTVPTALPADRHLDHVLHVAHVDAVARHRLPVDPDAQLRLLGFLLDRGVCRAGNLPEDRQRLFWPARAARRDRVR